jgi:peptidyl-prolyl cis-trans isomerase SurA
MGLILFLMIFLSSSFLCLCQGLGQDEDILMKIAGRDIEVGEFIRMYRKGLNPSGNSPNIDDYLEQFIAFKLKVADAIDNGYDTTSSFRKELGGYRDLISQNYLTDPEIKESLLQKAYVRSKTEVNASHILIGCPPDASPDDTLRAYRKALGIRDRILKGEDFNQVASASSDDKSVILNDGNLGYFTVFQMITPFEEAAYSLKPGNLSMPIKTQYGYHIIRVNSRRPSQGKIKVAHIMKAFPIGADDEIIRKAENEINEIYTNLLKGDSFIETAASFSDHKASAVKGGELNWFGAGEIVSDFSEAAFSIKDTGEFTKPVRTVSGFHIIKLLDRRAPESFEELKPLLESKLNKSDLISKARQSFVNKLKKEYEFTVNPLVYNWFVNNTDSLIIKGITSYNRNKIPEGNIYSFKGRNLTANEFADQLENRGFRVNTNNIRLYIDSSIESIASSDIINYENSILEEKYPDFRYLMKEFHDGILLFEISSEKIWNRVQEDSTGLMAYYERNKHKFLTDENIDAKIYSIKEAGRTKQLQKSYRKFSRKADTDKKMLEKFIVNNDTLITITQNRWFRGDDEDIDRIDWKKGVQDFYKNGLPSIIDINKVNRPEPRPFNEIQGEIVSGYQDWLTEEWIRQLNEKYVVDVDKEVYKGVKYRLQNE